MVQNPWLVFPQFCAFLINCFSQSAHNFKVVFLIRPLLAHFQRKMAQLCLRTKIHTKRWLVLGASAIQCCYNFACLHTRQDEAHIWKDDFFFTKIGIFCKSIASPLSEAKTHWIVNWLQLLNQLNFVWRQTKVFMQNSF